MINCKHFWYINHNTSRIQINHYVGYMFVNHANMSNSNTSKNSELAF